MPVNLGLAQASNALLLSTVVIYALAMLAYACDFAFGRRPAAAAAIRVPELVGSASVAGQAAAAGAQPAAVAAPDAVAAPEAGAALASAPAKVAAPPATARHAGGALAGRA